MNENKFNFFSDESLDFLGAEAFSTFSDEEPEKEYGLRKSINSLRNPLEVKQVNGAGNLDSALQQCQASAHRGYEIASENIKKTGKAIKNVSESLSQCLQINKQGSVRTPEIVEQLKKQFVSVVNELEQLQSKTEIDLQDRKKRLNYFSITLFGRTMAGKSTLMEILTRGEGHSIGLGAQRTTRDVRKYVWNGLEVTDVPGIAAFEGKEDEELAFEAAKQADLVLFLITDDAPQHAEAECLAKIRSLGKPVIGICNVKIAVDDPDDFCLFLYNPDSQFDQGRLCQIFNQFNSFVDRLIPGKKINFIETHLHSRFLAGQHQFSEYKSKLVKASRFSRVEQRIIREVTGRGSFLRIKSFIDGTIVPMTKLTDDLFEFSAQNSASGRVLVEKRLQLTNWAENFKEEGLIRIDTHVSKLVNKLRQEVSDFAEEHYEDDQAGKKWDEYVKSLGINSDCEKLAGQLAKDCGKALQEIARELISELSFVADFSADRSIKMDGIFDSKRLWDWGTTCLSGGLGLAALLGGPVSWGVVAVVGVLGWLFSFLFDDREKKACQAREKLSRKLSDNINKMEQEVKNKLQEWFCKELLDIQVSALMNNINIITSALFELADTQRTLARTLNKQIKHVSRIFIEEGLKHVNAQGMEYHICDIARIPGYATMFVIAPETQFPVQIKKALEQLIDESIWFVIDNGNPKSILSQAIGRGCDRNKVRIDPKLKMAYVPKELDPSTRIRIKLAQQLTGFHITNER